MSRLFSPIKSRFAVLGIGLHAGPVLGVDQLDDQAAERGGVLDILPRLFEDRPEHPGLLARFAEARSSRILR